MESQGKFHRVKTPAVLITLLLLLTACSNGNDNSSSPSKPQAANPTVEGPITTGGGPDCCKIAGIDITAILNYTPGTPFYTGVYFNESELGYRETEYFISGTASSYIATGDLGQDGKWSVEKADTAPFKTRIVVLRPENAADFNGTVMVEWLNVSGGVDAAPDWVQMHTELVRSGIVWVGVSAQSVGIQGGGSSGFDVSLKVVDPTRYASLSHPGDSFSYDIYSQAAQAVRHPVGIDPLDGLNVERMIAVGESQSAGRMATYVNAIHPTVDLFNGFIIHSRGSGAAALSQAPQAVVTAPAPTFIRNDFPEPVIGVETETDYLGLNRTGVHQPDASNFRQWDVAGNAHYDVYGVIKGPQDRGVHPSVAKVIERTDAGAGGLISCALPINDGPGHWVLKAAIHAMDHWIRTGEAAPSADPLLLNDDKTDFQRDQWGNALGGIRTPYVDAPVATFSGLGQTGNSFCFLFGTTKLFDDATLSTLYPTQQDYVDAINAATDSAVEKGFILPPDGDLIKAEASPGPEYLGGLTYYAEVSNYTDKYLQVNPYTSSCMNTHGGDDGHNLAPGQTISLQLVTSDGCAQDYPYGVSSQYFKYYLLDTPTSPYDTSNPYLIGYLVLENLDFNPHAAVYFTPTWDFSSGYISNTTMAPDPIGKNGYYNEHAIINFCKSGDARCDNLVFTGSETGFDYCSPTGGDC